MQNRSPYLKAAAVICAVCLLGGFVAYRAGAFDSPPPAAPVADDAAADPTLPNTASPESNQFMAGSKFEVMFKTVNGTAITPVTTVPPDQPGQSTGGTPAPGTNPAIFIGGSKSAAVFDPSVFALPSGTQPNPPPTTPSKKEE